VATCRQSPYLHKPAIVIVTSFSLTTSRAYGAGSPRSHYDVTVTVTSFATELATPTVTDERTDTLPRLMYKDIIIYTGIGNYTRSTIFTVVSTTKDFSRSHAVVSAEEVVLCRKRCKTEMLLLQTTGKALFPTTLSDR